MTVQQIADRLVELCRKGENLTAYQELFSPDAVAHEMPGVPGGTTEGREALIAKGNAWEKNLKELHKMEVSDPLVYGNMIAVGMGIDLTKQDGTREGGDEMCVYEVKDGKIISERFFYPMG